MLTPSLNTVMPRLLIAAAVIVALMLAVAFFAPAASAQDANSIDYDENGTGSVRVFTSTDPDGGGIDWDVTGLDADDFTIDDRGVLMFKSSPNYEAATDRPYDANGNGSFDDAGDEATANNTYRVTVRATEQKTFGSDPRALSTKTDVIVNVMNLDEPGTVTMSLREPQVTEPITATLSDPDGTATQIQWNWYVSKVTDPLVNVSDHWIPATGSVENATAVTVSYTPVVADVDKFLRAVVTYNDPAPPTTTNTPGSETASLMSEFDVHAVVSDAANGSPGFSSSGDYTRTVSESITVGSPVGAAVVATDPNGDTLTYSLHNGSGNDNLTNTPAADLAYFSVNHTNGQVSVKKALSYEAAPPTTYIGKKPAVDGEYTFYVRATDPSNEHADRLVTVNATDVNDAPKINGSWTADQITANAGTDTGAHVAPGAAPSELRVDEKDDDAPDSYTGSPDMLLPTPTNSGLGNPNVFTASDEDARGQITWSLEGVDEDDFVLTNTSADPTTGLRGPDEPVTLRFAAAPDFENPTDDNKDSVYKVTLVATDSRGATDKRPLTIFVDNVHEMGKVTLTDDQPYTDDPVTASVIDPDNGVAVITWQWTRATSTAHFSTTANLNTIAANEDVIEGATSDTYTPVKDDDGYYLMARATYTDMTSNKDVSSTVDRDERTQKLEGDATVAQVPNVNDGTAATTDKTYRVAMISKNAVRVSPTDPDKDTAPVFSAASYDRTVAENSEVGSVVGDPIRVAEKGSFTYSLKDTTSGDDSYFTVDSTGQIRVDKVDFPSPVPAGVDDCGAVTCPDEADPSLDYETKKEYTLTISATDTAKPTRGKATATVNITLEDLNESPYFDLVSRETAGTPIQYAETRTNAVMQLAVTEPDGAGLTWEVVGTDAADFKLEPADDIPGEAKKRRNLEFKSQPDFENPTDRAHNADGLHALSTDAGDDAAKNRTYKVTVRVTETAPAAGPKKSAELDVTVTLQNSREAGTAYLTLLQPEVGTQIGFVASDPDGTVSPTAHQWYHAKVDNPDKPDPNNLGAQWEMISGATGNTYDTAAATAQVGKKLLVLLTYQDTADTAATPQATSKMVAVSEYPVRADVSDNDNNSPDFGTDKTTRTVSEDAAVGTNVGAPVDLVNEDVGEILTYDLDDNDAIGAPAATGDHTFFSINRATGQVMVKKTLSAERTDGRDYVTDSDNDGTPDNVAGKYVFWVSATDPSNEPNGENHDAIEVTVTATNVNEAPKVLGMSELVVNEADSSNKNFYRGLEYRMNPANPAQYLNAGGNGWVAADAADFATTASTTSDNRYTRSEEDTVDGSMWPDNPIMGDDGGHFEYSVAEDGISRRLHFKSPPDFENPMDKDKDNVYEVTIKVTDNAGAEGLKAVRITVLNVDEKGTLSFSTDDPTDDARLVATVSDPDSPNGVVYTNWIWFKATTSNAIAAQQLHNNESMFPDNDDNNDNANYWTHVTDATSGSYQGKAGEYLWVRVDYRDGASVEDDPVTVLDERNDNPANTETQEHKLAADTNSDGLLTDDELDTDTTDHNSDEMLTKLSSNAVRGNGGGGGGGGTGPSTDRVDVTLSVPENTPSTGYVGVPVDLEYDQSASVKAFRNTIGGPDGGSFVLAEEHDDGGDTPDTDYYDVPLRDSGNNSARDAKLDDKKGQLALKPVTHLDYETKKTYIVEITDNDAVVAVGAVRVTINVTNVNDPPTAPKEHRGDPPVRNVAPDFAATTTTRTVAENMATGTPVGAPVSATDADDDPITYSLGTTTDDMAFDISTSTGQISTKAPLDYETKSSYSVTVTATDDNDASSSIMVTIMVTDEGLGAAAHGYDADESGVIESDEVLQAVAHYFAGTINQTQVLEVVALYFAGLPPSGS